MHHYRRLSGGNGKRLVYGAIVGAVLATLWTSAVTAATFVVTNPLDVPDITHGDGACATLSGSCTLRAAIQEANALPGPDTITVVAGVYALTMAGSGENAAATGDLDITESVDIVGAGAASTVVDAAGLGDRVFHIISGTVHIFGITIEHGSVVSGTVSGGSPDDAADLERQGGGILNFATLTLTDSIVAHNTDSPYYILTGAGGIRSTGPLTLNRSVVDSNSCDRTGGGINSSDELTIIDSVISSNTAGYSGGGIFGGYLIMTGSTITDNRAAQDCSGGIGGGGLVTPGGALTNCTVSGNHSGCLGGGILDSNSAVTLRNVTVTGNVADDSGGGIFVLGGNVNGITVSNSIIAGNSAVSSPDCHNSGAHGVTSAGYNLIQDITGCTISGDPTGNQIGVDPNLGPLADNGGPTPTHALLSGSPAIDTGNPLPTGNAPACPTADQRGVPRPVGGAPPRCDIGAYEGTVCGDSVVHAPAETCDHGSANGNDGCCSSTCHLLGPDSDHDGLCDAQDPCPDDPTNDGDGDGICGAVDNCPTTPNPDQRNSDGPQESGPKMGDMCDACPDDPNDTCNSTKTAKAVIDANGTGTTPLVTGDGSLTIAVPPGALSGPTSVSITGFTGPSGVKHCFGSTNEGEICSDATQCSGGTCAHNYSLGTNSTVFSVDLQPERQCQGGTNGGAPCTVASECRDGGSCVPLTFSAPVALTFTWLDEDQPSTQAGCTKGDGKVDNTGITEGNLKISRNGSQLGQSCKADAGCDVCANRWTIQVNHFSEYTLLGSCAAVLSGAKLTLAKIPPPPGDDTLKFQGTFTRDTPMADLNPLTNGLQLTLDDDAGTVLDVMLPPGAFDSGTMMGWKVNARSTKWTYANSTQAPPGGIVKVVVQDIGDGNNTVKFSFKGKAGDYPASSSVHAEVALPGAAECVEARFPGPAPLPKCTFNKSGTALKCK